MSDARLDPSDAQIARHAMGQLAEQAGIMRQCLIEQAFIGAQLDHLLEIWWETTLKQAFSPDMIQIMSGLNDLLKPGEEE